MWKKTWREDQNLAKTVAMRRETIAALTGMSPVEEEAVFEEMQEAESGRFGGARALVHKCGRGGADGGRH